MHLLAVHAVITIDAVLTIESFGWVDCKNIVHMMIIFKNNAELILMHGFVGSTLS
jgi:hypothetical protein